MVLIYEVEPWPSAQVDIEAHTGVQKRHDAGPYTEIAP
jgi:hypothetical protein